MKPSVKRNIILHKQVWAFLWRIMPKACKEYHIHRKRQSFTIDYGMYNDGVQH